MILHNSAKLFIVCVSFKAWLYRHYLNELRDSKEILALKKSSGKKAIQN